MSCSTWLDLRVHSVHPSMTCMLSCLQIRGANRQGGNTGVSLATLRESIARAIDALHDPSLETLSQKARLPPAAEGNRVPSARLSLIALPCLTSVTSPPQLNCRSRSRRWARSTTCDAPRRGSARWGCLRGGGCSRAMAWQQPACGPRCAYMREPQGARRAARLPACLLGCCMGVAAGPTSHSPSHPHVLTPAGALKCGHASASTPVRVRAAQAPSVEFVYTPFLIPESGLLFCSEVTGLGCERAGAS